MEEQSDTPYYLSSCSPYSETAAANPMRAYSKKDCAEIIAHEGGTAYVLAEDYERALATATRERDEARAIANDRDAMVDHRDRALTAMYQRVDVITQERDEARAEVEGLRSALLTLANAADDVGVQFFDMEDPPISVAQMQSATLAARAALAALQEAKP